MWKHKTKWLVRGGRKVRCYLCGKKILAKGDLFLFHGDTGYYSHQSCMTESTTISGNERRRAVKKIAVGAAVVGAIAAGAGKLIDISSQSKGSNSPAAQTILTSQGLIPPALTSDPANPVPGQMWYRSDAGVMAHFDAVQNRVVYSSEINDGNVNVTSKGIVNGLSVLPNDGKGGFGPDTTLGATAPGQYGSPYTESTGIQEGSNYAIVIMWQQLYQIPPTIVLSTGIFNINTPFTINYKPSGNPNLSLRNWVFKGQASTGTWIFSNHNSGYSITLAPELFYASNIEFDNIQPAVNSPTYTPAGFLNAGFSSTHTGTNVFQSYNFDGSGGGYTQNTVYLVGFQSIFLYNFEDYGSSDTLGITDVNAMGGIFWYGGWMPGSLTLIGASPPDPSTPQICYVSANGVLTTVNVGGFDSVVFENCNINIGTGINITGDIGTLQLIGGTLACYFIVDSSLSPSPTINALITTGTTLHLLGNFAFINNVSITKVILHWGNIVLNGFTYSQSRNPFSPSSFTANPPVSGTPQLNPNIFGMFISVPITFPTTANTAVTAYLRIGISPTAGANPIADQIVEPDTLATASGRTLMLKAWLPVGYYFEVDVTNATIGTIVPLLGDY